jgi:outer membrane protein assembly factor BamB
MERSLLSQITLILLLEPRPLMDALPIESLPIAARRRAAAPPAVLLSLVLAFSGCGAVGGKGTASMTPTVASRASVDVTPGTQQTGAAVGYLVTCETFASEDPPSCFLRPLNASDGSPRWTRHLTQHWGSLIADAQTIYVMQTNIQTGASILVAYNASDGTQRWQTTEADSIGPAAVTADAVYGGRFTDGQMVISALRAADGQPLWKTPVGQHTLRQLIVADGRVYARLGMAGSDGPPDDHLIVLDTASGKTLWKADIAGEAGPMALANGALYLRVTPSGALDSAIFAYRGDNGAILWRHTVPLQGPPNLLVATSDAVYAASSVAGDTAALGGVAALSASSGALLWSAHLGATAQFFAGLVVLNGVVYTATAPAGGNALNANPDGHLYAISAATGAILIDHDVTEGGILNLQASAGMLFIWTNPNAQPPIGALEALAPSDFSIKWKAPIDNRNPAWFQAG